MKQEKRKRRRDGSEGLLFKDVRLHRREATGNKRLGGLLLRQTIHSGCKQWRRSSAEVVEWKSEDGEMNVAGGEMICRHVLQYCTTYCTAL